MSQSNVADGCPVPQGTLLIIGGKEDKGAESGKENDSRKEILKAFISLTEKENPCIEIITSASGEGDEMFEDYQKVFRSLNAGSLRHIHHSKRIEVLEDDLSERIRSADAFFFTGGDQLKISSLYGGSAFLVQLKQRYISDKIVIAGTSAGAMAMSTPMIYSGSKDKQQIVGELKVTTGLEFLKDVCIDTHFIDRSRFIRLAQIIATNPTSIGIGIEEDTAIIIRKGSEAEVTGNSIVTIIEGFGITDTNITAFNEDMNISIENLKVHLLAKGRFYTIPQVNPPHK